MLVYRVKTRLQVQSRQKANATGTEQELHHHHYESTLHAIQKILADEGVSGLYSGISSALIGVVSTNFAYFYWYSVVRTLYFKSQGNTIPPGTAAELSLGAVAGAMGQIFTIPISVVTTRQQMQTKAERQNMLVTAREILESDDGVSGLWRGLKASLVLVVNPSITYGAYQRLKDGVFPNKTNLRPSEAFRRCCAADCVFQSELTSGTSSWSCIEVSCNDCDSALDCREGALTVQPASRKTGQEIQDIR